MKLEKEFDIGTIVFLKLKDKVSVHPCLILEKSRFESLNGSRIDYIVQLPDNSKSKFSSENEHDTEFFKDLTELESYLAEQLTTAVANMVKRALEEEKLLRSVLETLKQKND